MFFQFSLFLLCFWLITANTQIYETIPNSQITFVKRNELVFYKKLTTKTHQSNPKSKIKLNLIAKLSSNRLS